MVSFRVFFSVSHFFKVSVTVSQDVSSFMWCFFSDSFMIRPDFHLDVFKVSFEMCNFITFHLDVD